MDLCMAISGYTGAVFHYRIGTARLWSHFPDRETETQKWFVTKTMTMTENSFS